MKNLKIARELKITSELARAPDIFVIDFVNAILEDAFFLRASDIHLHPSEESIRIRFRVDGMLCDISTFSHNIFSKVVLRLKIISNLRTDEQKTPQDGRFRCSLENTSFDVRISFVSTHYGESVVLRLLTNTLGDNTLSGLGFLASDEENILREIKRQNGMILMTGPTGSGKTTTLYTLVRLLNRKENSIITIEDPIEYALAGIKQIQTQPRVGLTFANGLRSILRQDPDIIMVGEIRDNETAQIAINTALTGHLLLSTLHTVDCATAIPRFLDMGIEPFLVASTLRLVIAQRLVRKICVHCKVARPMSMAEKETLHNLYGHDLQNAFYGIGCENCAHSGYNGRVVVNEILVVDDLIRDAIVARLSAVQIKNIAMNNGMVSLVVDGLRKVEMGLTTIEEIFRCLHD